MQTQILQKLGIFPAIFFVCSCDSVPECVKLGDIYLNLNNFSEAVNEYNKIPDKSAFFSKKDSLINNAKTEAATYYWKLIVGSMGQLDSVDAIADLKELNKSNPNATMEFTLSNDTSIKISVKSKDDILSGIKIFGDNYFNMASSYENNKSFQSGLSPSDKREGYREMIRVYNILLNSKSYRNLARRKVDYYSAILNEQITDSLKGDVQSLVKAKNFDAAKISLNALSNFKSESLYVAKMLAVVEKQEQWIQDSIDEADVASSHVYRYSAYSQNENEAVADVLYETKHFLENQNESQSSDEYAVAVAVILSDGGQYNNKFGYQVLASGYANNPVNNKRVPAAIVKTEAEFVNGDQGKYETLCQVVTAIDDKDFNRIRGIMAFDCDKDWSSVKNWIEENNFKSEQY
jgi:hypothetical protein